MLSPDALLATPAIPPPPFMAPLLEEVLIPWRGDWLPKSPCTIWVGFCAGLLELLPLFPD